MWATQVTDLFRGSLKRCGPRFLPTQERRVFWQERRVGINPWVTGLFRGSLKRCGPRFLPTQERRVFSQERRVGINPWVTGFIHRFPKALWAEVPAYAGTTGFLAGMTGRDKPWVTGLFRDSLGWWRPRTNGTAAPLHRSSVAPLPGRRRTVRPYRRYTQAAARNPKSGLSSQNPGRPDPRRCRAGNIPGNPTFPLPHESWP